MKNLTITLTFIALAITIHAQPPQAFKYQAAARDNAGNILANQNVSFKMSILQGTLPGTVVYCETHAVTTNYLGLVTLDIGRGTVISGDFNAISWGSTPFFMKTELDPAGGSAFINMGTSELLSVPYALYSEQSGNPPGWSLTGNSETDPSANFLGTTDNKPLKLRVNNILSGIIDPTLNNTSFGINSLFSNTSGINNTAYGQGALFTNTTGSNNTLIGSGSDVSSNAISNATGIGYNTLVTGSNQVRLGNNDVTSLFCQGAYNATTANPSNLYVDASGQIMRSTSANDHVRLHLMNSVSDHSATNWRMFYSNGMGSVSELELGNSGQILQSNGNSAAPSWTTMATESDGVIGNEVLDASAGGGLLRSGVGTGIDPYTLGISWGGNGLATTASRSDHTHANDHLKWHSMTSVTDHSANNWQMFYSNGSGNVMELPNGTAGQVMQSNGTEAAPSWAAESDGVIGNEVANATTNGGLLRNGMGTAADPYTLGISWGGNGIGHDSIEK